MGKGLRTIFPVVLTAALLAVVPLNAAGAGEFRLAVPGPLTPPGERDPWDGAALAAEEINAAGGVHLKAGPVRVVLVPAETGGRLGAGGAAPAEYPALRAGGADFILGVGGRAPFQALGGLAGKFRGIFLLAGAPPSALPAPPGIPPHRFWFDFSSWPRSNATKAIPIVFASVAAQLGRALGRPPKVAILAEPGEWADGLVHTALELIPHALGLTLAGVWRTPAAPSDPGPELQAIRATGADLIFAVFSAPRGLLLERRMAEKKMAAVACCTVNEGPHDGGIGDAAGKASHLVALDTYGDGDLALTEKTIPFVTKFRRRFGRTPGPGAVTYDAVLMLKEAAELAGENDGEKIALLIGKMDRVGTFGRLKFDGNHRLIFGPGFLTGIAVQRQGSAKAAIWPHQWSGVAYAGVRPLALPPPPP